MDVQLNEIEVRVLGSLMEKEFTTPDYYPLSLHALAAACNQKSNRDPALSLEEDQIETALESLRAKGLALVTTGGDNRVPKHSHRLGEVFNFDRREQALLCVLMLRGPQTVGELRGRSDRMHNFDSLAEVEATLVRLAERTPAMAAKLARQPGEKEPRFAHLLAGDVTRIAPLETPPERRPGLEERVELLEQEVADLRRRFEEFHKSFE